MNFNEIVVKESPGLCRCCLSEGCYKDLSSEYTWMNESEVYADMLLECFDISISQQNEGPDGSQRLVCEVCITRLRDACNFKKQVMDSEKKFVDMLGRGEFRPKVVVYQSDMKVEENAEVMASDNEAEVEYLEDDADYVTELLKTENSMFEEATRQEMPAKAKRGRPRKNPSSKPEKKTKVVKASKSDVRIKKAIKGETRGGQRVKSKVISTESSHEDDSGTSDEEPIMFLKKSKIPPKDKRNAMRENVLQVLKYSSAMPFRWLKSSYRCFYCYNIFQESSDLKDHQSAHLGDEIKEQVMNNYWEPVVYVDISNLSCKICSESHSDLYDFIDHLVDKHAITYNKDVGICIVAFKLDNLNLNCLVCGASFYTFGPLLYHTNKDHKGVSAILCDVCGQNFKDRHLLRLHVKTVHDNTGLLCTRCGEKFETRAKLKTHQKNQHDIDKKFKCLVCPETFRSHYKRSRHMAEEHKSRREIKCLHCPKVFVFRSMMMTHLRDTHLKVRNHICGVCGFSAFNANRLKNHMYKHSGEKNFKCDACDKAFSTKKIMKAHYARMHKALQPPIIQYENHYVGQ